MIAALFLSALMATGYLAYQSYWSFTAYEQAQGLADAIGKIDEDLLGAESELRAYAVVGSSRDDFAARYEDHVDALRQHLDRIIDLAGDNSQVHGAIEALRPTVELRLSESRELFQAIRDGRHEAWRGPVLKGAGLTATIRQALRQLEGAERRHAAKSRKHFLFTLFGAVGITLLGCLGSIIFWAWGSRHMRRNEELLRRVCENADVGLTRLSRDLIYHSANPAYARIAGKPLEQIIGYSMYQVLGADGVEKIRPYIERTLRGERVTYETAVPFVGAGSRFLHVSYAPDANEAGEIVGWVASVTDITARKDH